MADLQPCSHLIDDLESYISSLNDIKNNIYIFKLNMKSAISALYDVTDTTRFAEQLRMWSEDTFGFGSDLYEDIIQKYTGSCLDDLIRSMKRNIYNPAYHISRKLSPQFYEDELLDLLSNLKGQVNQFGIPNIMTKINQVLGCLSSATLDNNCLQRLTVLNDLLDEIQSEAYIDDLGNFNLNGFLGDVEGMTSDLKENLTEFSDKIDEIGPKIINNFDK